MATPFKKVRDTAKHVQTAQKQAKNNGGIQSKVQTKYGVKYNYNNGTGYWIGKKD